MATQPLIIMMIIIVIINIITSCIMIVNWPEQVIKLLPAAGRSGRANRWFSLPGSLPGKTQRWAVWPAGSGAGLRRGSGYQNPCPGLRSLAWGGRRPQDTSFPVPQGAARGNRLINTPYRGAGKPPQQHTYAARQLSASSVPSLNILWL